MSEILTASSAQDADSPSPEPSTFPSTRPPRSTGASFLSAAHLVRFEAPVTVCCECVFSITDRARPLDELGSHSSQRKPSDSIISSGVSSSSSMSSAASSVLESLSMKVKKASAKRGLRRATGGSLASSASRASRKRLVECIAVAARDGFIHIVQNEAPFTRLFAFPFKYESVLQMEYLPLSSSLLTMEYSSDGSGKHLCLYEEWSRFPRLLRSVQLIERLTGVVSSSSKISSTAHIGGSGSHSSSSKVADEVEEGELELQFVTHSGVPNEGYVCLHCPPYLRLKSFHMHGTDGDGDRVDFEVSVRVSGSHGSSKSANDFIVDARKQVMKVGSSALGMESDQQKQSHPSGSTADGMRSSPSSKRTIIKTDERGHSTAAGSASASASASSSAAPSSSSVSDRKGHGAGSSHMSSDTIGLVIPEKNVFGSPSRSEFDGGSSAISSGTGLTSSTSSDYFGNSQNNHATNNSGIGSSGGGIGAGLSGLAASLFGGGVVAGSGMSRGKRGMSMSSESPGVGNGGYSSSTTTSSMSSKRKKKKSKHERLVLELRVTNRNRLLCGAYSVTFPIAWINRPQHRFRRELFSIEVCDRADRVVEAAQGIWVIDAETADASAEGYLTHPARGGKIELCAPKLRSLKKTRYVEQMHRFEVGVDSERFQRLGAGGAGLTGLAAAAGSNGSGGSRIYEELLKKGSLRDRGVVHEELEEDEDDHGGTVGGSGGSMRSGGQSSLAGDSEPGLAAIATCPQSGRIVTAEKAVISIFDCDVDLRTIRVNADYEKPDPNENGDANGGAGGTGQSGRQGDLHLSLLSGFTKRVMGGMTGPSSATALAGPSSSKGAGLSASLASVPSSSVVVQRGPDGSRMKAKRKRFVPVITLRTAPVKLVQIHASFMVSRLSIKGNFLGFASKYETRLLHLDLRTTQNDSRVNTNLNNKSARDTPDFASILDDESDAEGEMDAAQRVVCVPQRKLLPMKRLVRKAGKLRSAKKEGMKASSKMAIAKEESAFVMNDEQIAMLGEIHLSSSEDESDSAGDPLEKQKNAENEEMERRRKATITVIAAAKQADEEDRDVDAAAAEAANQVLFGQLGGIQDISVNQEQQQSSSKGGSHYNNGSVEKVSIVFDENGNPSVSHHTANFIMLPSIFEYNRVSNAALRLSSQKMKKAESTTSLTSTIPEDMTPTLSELSKNKIGGVGRKQFEFITQFSDHAHRVELPDLMDDDESSVYGYRNALELIKTGVAIVDLPFGEPPATQKISALSSHIQSGSKKSRTRLMSDPGLKQSGLGSAVSESRSGSFGSERKLSAGVVAGGSSAISTVGGTGSSTGLFAGMASAVSATASKIRSLSHSRRDYRRPDPWVWLRQNNFTIDLTKISEQMSSKAGSSVSIGQLTVLLHRRFPATTHSRIRKIQIIDPMPWQTRLDRTEGLKRGLATLSSHITGAAIRGGRGSNSSSMKMALQSALPSRFLVAMDSEVFVYNLRTRSLDTRLRFGSFVIDTYVEGALLFVLTEHDINVFSSQPSSKSKDESSQSESSSSQSSSSSSLMLVWKRPLLRMCGLKVLGSNKFLLKFGSQTINDRFSMSADGRRIRTEDLELRMRVTGSKLGYDRSHTNSIFEETSPKNVLMLEWSPAVELILSLVQRSQECLVDDDPFTAQQLLQLALRVIAMRKTRLRPLMKAVLSIMFSERLKKHSNQKNKGNDVTTGVVSFTEEKEESIDRVQLALEREKAVRAIDERRRRDEQERRIAERKKQERALGMDNTNSDGKSASSKGWGSMISSAFGWAKPQSSEKPVMSDDVAAKDLSRDVSSSLKKTTRVDDSKVSAAMLGANAAGGVVAVDSHSGETDGSGSSAVPSQVGRPALIEDKRSMLRSEWAMLTQLKRECHGLIADVYLKVDQSTVAAQHYIKSSRGFRTVVELFNDRLEEVLADQKFAEKAARMAESGEDSKQESLAADVSGDKSAKMKNYDESHFEELAFQTMNGLTLYLRLFLERPEPNSLAQKKDGSLGSSSSSSASSSSSTANPLKYISSLIGSSNGTSGSDPSAVAKAMEEDAWLSSEPMTEPMTSEMAQMILRHFSKHSPLLFSSVILHDRILQGYESLFDTKQVIEWLDEVCMLTEDMIEVKTRAGFDERSATAPKDYFASLCPSTVAPRLLSMVQATNNMARVVLSVQFGVLSDAEMALKKKIPMTDLIYLLKMNRRLWLDWRNSHEFQKLLCKCFPWEFGRILLEYVIDCYKSETAMYVSEQILNHNMRSSVYTCVLDEKELTELLSAQTKMNDSSLKRRGFGLKTALDLLELTELSGYLSSSLDSIEKQRRRALAQCYLEGALRYLMNETDIFERYMKMMNRKLALLEQTKYDSLYDELQKIGFALIESYMLELKEVCYEHTTLLLLAGHSDSDEDDSSEDDDNNDNDNDDSADDAIEKADEELNDESLLLRQRDMTVDSRSGKVMIPSELSLEERKKMLKEQRKIRDEERKDEIEKQRHVFRSQFPMITISFPDWITEMLEKQSSKERKDQSKMQDDSDDDSNDGSDGDHKGTEKSANDDDETALPTETKQISLMTRICTVLSSVRFDTLSESTAEMYCRRIEELLASCPDIPAIYASIIAVMSCVANGRIEVAIQTMLSERSLRMFIVEFSLTHCRSFQDWSSLLSQLLNRIRELNARCDELTRLQKTEQQSGEENKSEKMDPSAEDEARLEDAWSAAGIELRECRSERLFVEQCYSRVWKELNRLSSIGQSSKSASAADDKEWLKVTDLISIVPDDGNLEFFAPIFADLMRSQSADLMNVSLFERVVRMERDRDSVLSQQIHKLAHLPDL